MKLQVTQENLAKALNAVAKVANARNTLPVLANVLIKTTGNRLKATATNLDIAISYTVGSKINDPGEITIPARLTQDFVTTLPAGTLTLEQDEKKLHISMDNYSSTINGIAAEEFPAMPDIKPADKLTVSAGVFKQALQQTLFAAGTDEARAALTGCFLHTSGNKLLIATTDGYRLAEKSLGKTPRNVSLLVPANALQDLLRVITDFDGEITIASDGQQALFKAGEAELTARLIEAGYPDYKKLIPTKFQTTATIKKADLTSITKVSSLFARESAGSITIKLSGEEQRVSINSIASQLGENSAVAEAKVKGGGEITLNSRYLLDVLGVLNTEEIEFSFNGKLEPVVIKPVGDDSYLHVIMPLKS